jgi:hypothetical protein
MKIGAVAAFAAAAVLAPLMQGMGGFELTPAQIEKRRQRDELAARIKSRCKPNRAERMAMKERGESW